MNILFGGNVGEGRTTWRKLTQARGKHENGLKARHSFSFCEAAWHTNPCASPCCLHFSTTKQAYYFTELGHRLFVLLLMIVLSLLWNDFAQREDLSSFQSIAIGRIFPLNFHDAVVSIVCFCSSRDN